MFVPKANFPTKRTLYYKTWKTSSPPKQKKNGHITLYSTVMCRLKAPDLDPSASALPRRLHDPGVPAAVQAELPPVGWEEQEFNGLEAFKYLRTFNTNTSNPLVYISLCLKKNVWGGRCWHWKEEQNQNCLPKRASAKNSFKIKETRTWDRTSPTPLKIHKLRTKQYILWLSNMQT